MSSKKKILLVSFLIIIIITIISLLFKSRQEISENETNILESLQSTDEVSESNGDDLKQGIGDISDNLVKEQPIFIGRQPPIDYVEPESLDPRQFEFQLALKDTYQSNIVIIPEEISMLHLGDHEWIHLLSEFSPFNYGDTVLFVVYAILTYYDGNVPYDYYVHLKEDTHNRHPESATIFEVQTHGERPLNICIDMYNYRIRVDEGMKQKNPNCIQGCCD
ncbi:MAG: hypothetical protein FWE14_03315 [Lachnospiraceae bacterium]|nr:hypothetical protein [Lachnospiraceae bacterium]